MKKKIKVETNEGESVAENAEESEEQVEEELSADAAEETEVEDSAEEEQSEDDVEEDSEEEEAEVEDNENFGEELAVLRNEFEAIKEENQQNYDKYLRAIAELENTKKRAQKERSELIRYAGEHLARDLLEVADSLDLALKDDNAEAKNEVDFIEGVKLIREQLTAVLSRHSIKGESYEGKEFDPEKHDAMVSVPTADHEPGIIIEEFKKAYFFKDKLLRPAQVVVSAKLEQAEEAPAEEEAAKEEAAEAEVEDKKSKKKKKKKKK